MKKSNLLVILGNIYNCIDNEYLKYLLLSLFNSIKDNELDNLDLKYLDLFDYDKIKYEYHNVKNSVDIILEYFNLNKYNDLINVIRVNNGLGYDNSYLTKLYNDLVKINDYDKLNNRFKGLFNLLNDSNLVYNNIGIRIIIAKYLLSIDISKLKVYQLDNTRLNDKYKFLVFKNNKIKNYSKLYFIGGNIVLSTLQHDKISNVVFTLNELNSFYGGNNDITDNNDLDLDLNKYKYEFNDNGIYNVVKYLYYLIDKYDLLEKGIPKYKVNQLVIDYDSINVNDNNLYRFIRFFNKNYRIIQRYDLLNELYDKIIKYLSDLDDFNSNDLNSKSIKKLDSLDYYKYQIDLKDYFLYP